MSPNNCSSAAFLLLASLLIVGPAQAGDLLVSWDASPTATSYVVHYGTSPGQYSHSTAVGNVTQTSVDGLENCRMWYFAATAVNDAGESPYSNQDSSWPRATTASVAPSSVERGSSLNLVLSGTNFQAGSTVQFSGSGITVNSVAVSSCSQINVNVTVGAGASIGASDVTVTNASGVSGSSSGLFTVTAATVPTVVSATPENGATAVSESVQPTVQFSEAVSAATISTATVRLLDEADNPVGQATGSPSLSANGRVVTIVPAAPLEAGQSYRIQVIGGSGGVADPDGHVLASTFTQASGFQIDGEPDQVPDPPQDLMLSFLDSLHGTSMLRLAVLRSPVAGLAAARGA